MIIDTKDLKDVDVTKNSVVGRAVRTTHILERDQTVFMVEGVRAYVDKVAKDYPYPMNEGYSNFGGRFGECVDTFLNHADTLVHYDPTEIKPVDFMEQGLDLEYDVTGDFIDMGLHMEGVPESFGSLHNGNPRARRVRIYIDNGNAGGLSDGGVIRRSSRMIRLLDALEQANVRCELVTVESDARAHSECIVKRFSESLNLEDVAVATHPDFSRCLHFRIEEWSKTFDGYGSSLHLHEHVNSFASKFNDELTVFIYSNIYDPDQAFGRLEEELVKELSEPVPSTSLMKVYDHAVEKVGLNG